MFFKNFEVLIDPTEICFFGKSKGSQTVFKESEGLSMTTNSNVLNNTKPRHILIPLILLLAAVMASSGCLAETNPPVVSKINCRSYEWISSPVQWYCTCTSTTSACAGKEKMDWGCHMRLNYNNDGTCAGTARCWGEAVLTFDTDLELFNKLSTPASMVFEDAERTEVCTQAPPGTPSNTDPF